MQNQQPLPGNSSNYYQQPLPGSSNNCYQQPLPGSTNNYYQQPLPGSSNKCYQQPLPGRSNNYYQQPLPGSTNNCYQQPLPGSSMNYYQQPLPGSSANYSSSTPMSYFRTPSRSNQFFMTKLEALKRYKEQNGHMDVNVKENKALYVWISKIRNSIKSVQEGRTPRRNLTKEKIEMLKQIGFEFPPHPDSPPALTQSHPRKIKHEQFESYVEALKQFQAEHGHMRVTSKNKKLYAWIVNVRSNYKRIQKGLSPFKPLPQDQIDTLRKIGFDFRSQNHTSFESHIHDLLRYQETHGHMRVTRKQDKSLNNFVECVRRSLRRMKQGQLPVIKLTPDQITTLEKIGFSRATYGGSLISGMPSSSSCNSSKRQEVEERSHDNHEEISTSRTFTAPTENEGIENIEDMEDLEEIEGDIVPRWLISNEEEEDNGDSLLDEISIKIDGGTEVQCTSSTPVADACRSS